MMHQHFAYIDRTGRLSMLDLNKIAAVLHKQLNRDVSPKWGGGDTVIAIAKEADLPPHFVPLFIVDDSEMPEGALGYHTDTLGQAQAFISYQDGNLFGICKTGSHEGIETKLDYAGNRLVPSWHPVTNQPCRILLEGCDPPEALDYDINGFPVSDFILQEWYDEHFTAETPYTFLNSIPRPRAILSGGYVSFVDAQGNGFQQTWFGGPHPVLSGPFDWSADARGNRSLREIVDETTQIARKAA